MSPNLDEITGNVTTSDVKPTCKMWKCKSIINRAYVCNTVTGVNYDASLKT